ncbi:MAG: hypothetical protein ACRC7O_15325, partial [Fimbriiglobus sp.]
LDAELSGPDGPVVRPATGLSSNSPTSSFDPAHMMSDMRLSFVLAPGESVELTYCPFPGGVVVPGIPYQLVTVVTWLDADTEEKVQTRSAPFEITFTPTDLSDAEAKHKRCMEAEYTVHEDKTTGRYTIISK